MAIYLEYEGLKGNVTAAGYEGMIALDFFAFGVQRQINMKTGQMSNREVGLPRFSAMKMGKRQDSASPGILREAMAGAKGKRVTIHCVRTTANQPDEFLSYTFAYCLPVYYRIVDTQSELSPAAERLYLSYAAMEVSYLASGADNKAMNPQRYGYDVARAKSL